MTKRHHCPRCGYTRAWVIRRQRRRCARCRHEWGRTLPLRLTRHQWQTLLRWHTRGLSSHAISHETGLHPQRVLRALTVLRQRMLRDVPPHFRGTVEVDETYVGGAWKNKRRSQRHGGTSQTPVFGILCRGGHINGLEGFWGYLKRRLAAKGGIRKARLPLYLAEYVWRYNHRRSSLGQQVQQLMRLLER